MKHPLTLAPLALELLCAALVWSSLAPGADLTYATNGSGVYGYNDTPILPWCGFRVHDANRPAPPRVNPGSGWSLAVPAKAPADAIILSDGASLEKWEPTDWKLVDGCIEAVGGSTLSSRDSFGNCQIHLEFRIPESSVNDPWYNRGNNGVLLMGLFEVQIFDSWNEKIYPDGQAASIYAQTPPLANASLPPGQWQSYDLVFYAPVFQGGNLAQPARLTLFHNGVLVQHNQQIYGETGHRILPKYSKPLSRGPLLLGGHHCPVRFRNIWLRKL